MGKLKSRLALESEEARRLSQRGQIQAAMLASRGDVAEAARALGVFPQVLPRHARDAGLDWEALLAEAKAHGGADENRPTGT